MDNAEPLYFLTLITVLVVLLVIATVQTAKKRRAQSVTSGSPSPASTSGSLPSRNLTDN
jgi:hypothetical protein